MSYEEGLAEGLGLGLTVGKEEKRHRRKRCVRCHRLIPAYSKFCPFCGARQP